MARDPRWIVLYEDGGSATICRHREPDAEDIKAAEATLARAGKGGWLAVQSQSAHLPGLPEIVEVRPLGVPTVKFDDARGRLLERLRAADKP